MKIAILGSGGREHALTVSISKSSKIEKIYCIPGNAGTSEIATNIDLDINDFDSLYNFLNKNKSVLEITKFLNNLLERMILRNIDQWIWTHNRWKD